MSTHERTPAPFTPRILVGLVLIALGIVFTLDSFDVIDAGSIGDYWPLVLIIPGLASLAWPRRGADRLRGLILVAVGGLLLLRNLGLFWVSFHHVWPVVLVALGAFLLWRAMESRHPSPEGGDDAGRRAHDGAMAGLAATSDLRAPSVSSGDRLDEFAMFGGGDRNIRSQAFRGGSVTAILGGFDIDLRDAVMAGDAAAIEVFVMMGGVDLRVPEAWTVVIDVTPFMGGASYRRRGQTPGEGPPKVLTVRGFVFMGGVEIKH
jgi:cell wall-active antibiotic response 4TMS protein YvqF